MKVWISKYALSGGPIEAECEPWHGGVYIQGGRVWPAKYMMSMELGKEAHETREAALKAAEAMRKKKIASLKKQIADLEAMKFEE